MFITHTQPIDWDIHFADHSYLTSTLSPEQYFGGWGHQSKNQVLLILPCDKIITSTLKLLSQ